MNAYRGELASLDAESWTVIWGNAPIGIAVIGPEGAFEFANPKYCELYQQSVARLIGAHFSVVLPQAPHKAALQRRENEFPGAGLEGEWAIPQKGGASRHVSCSTEVASFSGIPGNLRRLVYVIDVSSRKRTEDSLTSVLARTKTIVSALPGVLVTHDLTGKYLSIESSDESHLMMEPAHLIGKNLIDVLPPDVAQAYQGALLLASATRKLQVIEYCLAVRGRLKHFEARIMATESDAIVSLIRDTSEQFHAAEALREMAFQDPLTQLPNRRLLLNRIDQALANCRRTKKFGALLFLDLDNFKTLNDTCGHEAGDELLQQVALRLLGCIREVDTVARMGGDEFVVMLCDLATSADAALEQTDRATRNILKCLNAPYRLVSCSAPPSKEYVCTPSIGVALFSETTQHAQDVLRASDVAMYEAKRLGGNQAYHPTTEPRDLLRTLSPCL